MWSCFSVSVCDTKVDLFYAKIEFLKEEVNLKLHQVDKENVLLRKLQHVSCVICVTVFLLRNKCSKIFVNI